MTFLQFKNTKSSLSVKAIAVSAMVAMPLISNPALGQSGEALDLETRMFEEVFADPTNLLLNFKLAGAQLQNGNFKGAIGTLERVLTLSPDNNQAQFLIANAHLRLGNNAEAERILNELLANPNATEVELTEARKLLSGLEKQNQRFTISGSYTIGGGVSDNPEGGSIDNLAESPGAIGVSTKQANAEEYITTSASVNFTGKLENQRDETIGFGLATSIKDYSQYNPGDLSILSANTRYMRGVEQGMLAATLNTARIHVGDKHYLNSYAASFNYSQTFLEKWNANANFGMTRTVFKKSFGANESEKTAFKTEASLRMARAFGRYQLGSTVKGSDSDARVKKNSKKTVGLSAFASTNIIPGISTLTYDITHTDHQDADTLYSSEKRKDRRHSVSVSHVIGLSSLSVPVGNEPRISVNSNFGKTKSNIANFTKYSGDLSLTLIQPF